LRGLRGEGGGRVGGKGGGGGSGVKWPKPCMHIWIIKEKKKKKRLYCATLCVFTESIFSQEVFNSFETQPIFFTQTYVATKL
jgi:hypothetical protein